MAKQELYFLKRAMDLKFPGEFDFPKKKQMHMVVSSDVSMKHLKKWLLMCDYRSPETESEKNVFAKTVYTNMPSSARGPLDDFGRVTIRVKVMNGAQIQSDASETFLSEPTENLHRDILESMVSTDPDATWYVPMPTKYRVFVEDMRRIIEVYFPEDEDISFDLFDTKGRRVDDWSPVVANEVLYLMPKTRVVLEVTRKS